MGCEHDDDGVQRVLNVRNELRRIRRPGDRLRVREAGVVRREFVRSGSGSKDYLRRREWFVRPRSAAGQIPYLRRLQSVLRKQRVPGN